jgi:hypothetical protein
MGGKSNGRTANSLRRRCRLLADDGNWSRFAGEIFLDWLAPPSGLRWIDIGCGNEAFTENVFGKRYPLRVLAV